MPRAKSAITKRPKKKNTTRRGKSASPESNLLKALFEAVDKTDVDAVRRLVEHGAINNKDIPFHRLNSIHRYSMLFAIAHYSITKVQDELVNREDALAIFRLLRDGGLEYSPKSINPSVFVDTWHHPEIFQELINNDYNINAVGFRGHSMLMVILADAVHEQATYSQEEYTFLINEQFDLGADINITNENGLDALMIATGHESLDNFWFYLFNDEDNVNRHPKPYYVNLLLENLKRTIQRYDFTNTSSDGDDYDAVDFTLEESLGNFREAALQEDGIFEHTGAAMLRIHEETIALIDNYKFAMRKPTKSANLGRSSFKSKSKSKSKSNSGSRRSSGASEGGAKKKSKKR